jgi:hypothetical protein
MSYTSCEYFAWLLPIYWLSAGGDLSRPSHIHTSAVRTVTRPEAVSKCPEHPPNLPCVQTCAWCRTGVPPAIDRNANIKSP